MLFCKASGWNERCGFFLQQVLCKTTSEVQWVSSGHSILPQTDTSWIPGCYTENSPKKSLIKGWRQTEDIHSATSTCSTIIIQKQDREHTSPSLITTDLQSKISAYVWRTWFLQKWGTPILDKNILVTNTAPFWKAMNHKKNKNNHLWVKYAKTLQKPWVALI